MNNITKLPDGSAFFTANIMSKDEAMKLPLKDRPICFRISSEIYHAVFEAIGEASMSWIPKPAGQFDSTLASDVASRLCFKIADEIERLQCPSCGTILKQDPCKPDKNVKVPKYDYLSEGCDPNKFPKKNKGR